MSDHLMTAAFIATLVPAGIVLALYLRTVWDNPGGRLMIQILFVLIGSTAVSSAALLFPGWAAEEGATWLRVGLRLAVAAVMWNVLRVYLRAQREGRREEARRADLRVDR